MLGYPAGSEEEREALALDLLRGLVGTRAGARSLVATAYELADAFLFRRARERGVEEPAAPIRDPVRIACVSEHGEYAQHSWGKGTRCVRCGHHDAAKARRSRGDAPMGEAICVSGAGRYRHHSWGKADQRCVRCGSSRRRLAARARCYLRTRAQAS